MRIFRRISLLIATGALLSLMAVSIVASATAPRRRLLDPTPLAVGPLKLSGRLVFTENQAVMQLDLTTGLLSTLFQPPSDGAVVALAVAPDQSQIAIAYQAPADTTTPNAIPRYGYTDIYLLPGNGSGAPKPYLKSADSDILILPFWSPDGKYLYYIHYDAVQDSYNLERVVYPDTKPETIVKQILFASISPDGSKITYLQQNPTSYQYTLYIADSSGANPIQLVASTVFYTMDVAIFSHDSQSVVFSASGQPTALVTPVGPIGVTDWFGKGIAMDGNIPSDLWQISVHGGAPKRLTNLGEFSPYPAFSPDGKHMAMLAGGGVYVMNPDGTALRRLLYPGGVGTLNWVP